MKNVLKYFFFTLALLNTHLSQAFDKAQVRSIVYALFSHNEQRDLNAKKDVETFVETLHADVFNNGTLYRQYSTRSGAIKIIDESVKWIGARSYRKSHGLMMGAYSSRFQNYRIEVREREKESVAKYIVTRMQSRSAALVSRVREKIYYHMGNLTATDVVNIIKSTLRTYVGPDLDNKIISEIDTALRAQCSCQLEENEFLIELACGNGHWMHRSCYNKWRASCFEQGLNVTCPICHEIVEPYSYYSAAISPLLTGLHFSINLETGVARFSFSLR